MKQQPWIYSMRVDGWFIVAPPFLVLLAVCCFPSFFEQQRSLVSVGSWVLLILLIDVSHVYSTLYRTYFDGETFRKQKNILLLIPLLCFIAGVILHSIDSLLFWRVMAYTAVFHFIRQQYGFMRIYSRKEQQKKWMRRVDAVTVYTAALYPVLYWHLHLPRSFTWFVEGDFYGFSWPAAGPIGLGIYLAILFIYLVKETYLVLVSRSFNVPRNLVILGTALSWYAGIVAYNGDLAFTALNVISHGIPYMALVWIYGRKKSNADPVSWSPLLRKVFSRYGLVLFLGIIFLFAYLEEGFWDALVWRDHPQVFGLFGFFPQVSDEALLSFIVPLLSLPQLTHYVIDGFIWKMKEDKFDWKNITLTH